MFLGLIFLCFVAGAFAQSGPCPKIPSEFVDPQRIAGKWFEYAISTNNQDSTSKCRRYYWTTPVNGVSTITFGDTSSLIDDRTRVVLEVRMDNNLVQGKLHLPVLGIMEKNYYVLETDYYSYSIVVSCEEQGNNHKFVGFVDTRSVNAPRNIVNIVENAFRKRGLAPVQMTAVDQSCQYE